MLPEGGFPRDSWEEGQAEGPPQAQKATVPNAKSEEERVKGGEGIKN